MDDLGVSDRWVIQCNLAEATNIATQGARAYVMQPNPGWGHERVQVLIRSRGGRWVAKWEALTHLEDFRVKTLPPEHPQYDVAGLWWSSSRETVAQTAAQLERACQQTPRSP